MKKTMIILLAMLLVFTLTLSACGSKDAPEAPTAAAPAETAPVPLGLNSFQLSATTWSSPNGATIHVNAVPHAYHEGQTATYIVRLEGEEVASIPCQWDGKAYTASADLIAENGLCYFLLLAEGEETVEISLSTPAEPYFESFINMADALNSYCNVTVEDSAFADGKLTLNAGMIQVQVPRITNDGQPITCQEVKLILSYNGEDISSQTLELEETDTVGLYHLAVSGISLDVPVMDSDEQLTLRLEAALSNGQSLTAPGGVWYNTDSGIMPALG